jgi:hypothetical protein
VDSKKWGQQDAAEGRLSNRIGQTAERERQAGQTDNLADGETRQKAVQTKDWRTQGHDGQINDTVDSKSRNGRHDKGTARK